LHGKQSEFRSPNIVLIFSDQHRQQATGYAGDPNVKTPFMDWLAGNGLNLSHAVSCAPVCSPYRASLLTGQYPLTHGVFVNDVSLVDNARVKPAVYLAEAFSQAGYDTAYIGKWHLDGRGRSTYIPPERRAGFDFWQVLECTHDYNHSYYYQGADSQPRLWEGYDAIAQTRSAQSYIRSHGRDKPFLLVVSWGPPHNPYETAPETFRNLYPPGEVQLRPNVRTDLSDKPYRIHTGDPREEIAGYYSHVTALDDCLEELYKTLEEEGQADNTVFIYTSDHGDMLWSHGEWRKQWPMDESIRVPFLVRCPALFGDTGREDDLLINTPDIMPTLLGLCGIVVPETVEGNNYAPHLLSAEHDQVPLPDAALISCIQPFSEFQKAWGGREYRGLRTHRYTYVRDLQGPWLLFDNIEDPYQLKNLCKDPAHLELAADLDLKLQKILDHIGDDFLPGEVYMHRWGYPMDASGAVPFEDILYHP
jgi:arylsulfatase A-like enzyme